MLFELRFYIFTWYMVYYVVCQYYIQNLKLLQSFQQNESIYELTHHNLTKFVLMHMQSVLIHMQTENTQISLCTSTILLLKLENYITITVIVLFCPILVTIFPRRLSRSNPQLHTPGTESVCPSVASPIWRGEFSWIIPKQNNLVLHCSNASGWCKWRTNGGDPDRLFL